MKFRILCFVSLLVLAISLPSYAQNMSITNGLNWLSVNQNADGSWGTNAATTVIDTTEVINAKINFGNDSSMQNAATWLTTQEATTVDELSREVSSLAYTGTDTSSLISALINAKNSENGWGYKAGHSSTPLDTSLAIQALKSANYADVAVINSALAYLTSSQNADGGWGFVSGVESNVNLTAIVAATLQQFPQMTSIATAVSKATTYLLAHQNPDGGFGDPSTVYETALAFISLVGNGQTQDLPLQNAVNYITATQSPNGSWNDDPYSTALALKALYLSENRPSPPPPPPAAGKFTGTLLDATTRQGVSGVTVALESSLLINTVTDASGNFTLADVPPGPQKVKFSLSGYASTSASATSLAEATFSLGTIPITSAYSTGTISGIIYDPTGKPLADVAIAVNGSWSGSAVTGFDGAFSFSFVSPGDVTITASKTGYQSFSGTGRVYPRTTLSISPRLSVTLSTISTGAIVGRVVDDMSGFPIDHLPEEQGVRVTISGGAFAEPDPNNGGRFTIDGLAANTYQVTVGMSGFISQTFRLIITPGVTTNLGVIRLVMSADTITLTGKVTNSITGLPIPAAEVMVVGSNLTARTDFAGTYVIADIKESGFTVKAAAGGYVGKAIILYQGGGRGARWTQQLDVSLTPLETKGSLGGVVVDAATGQPLSNVTLTLVSDPTVNLSTDSSGAFLFTEFPKGLQQLSLTLGGYLGRTLTTGVMPGMVNNVGNIPLSPDSLPAAIKGVVTDGMTNLPFAGVELLVRESGDRQTTTDIDGVYSVNDVTPGRVTVTATTKTPTGYFPASFTAPLEQGGILVFSTALFNNLSPTVIVALQTDKTAYSKGEIINISAAMQNLQAMELAATLRLEVLDPTGMAVYDNSEPANLAADGSLTRSQNFPLPLSALGGTYAVTASLYDATGRWIGVASQSFGVAVSRITVTPLLPAAFSAGANSVSFTLVNSGALPVATGIFAVTLKAPDGQVVTSTEQQFSLRVGESKTLLTTISVPQLKFGTYTLACAQSDETRSGKAMEFSLPAAVAINATFDSNSHRVRNSAGLTVTLTNSGRFNLDTGALVTITVPDAAFAESRNLSPTPAVGSASTLLYQFPIPAYMTAGEHITIVTVTLPSGSTATTGAKLVIFEANLALTPLPGIYAAGSTIDHLISNSGGVDAPVQYFLRLYDTKGALIAEKSSSETVIAGDSLPATLIIPTGVVDGSYNLVVNFKDLTTGREEIVTHLLDISGVKGSLQVQTGKQSYLTTESITGSSVITNSEISLLGGNLHLQVTNATGSRQQKTWTSQFDFQQGTRSGVNTFETPDAVTLASFSDNFNDGILNTDRWALGPATNGPLPSEQSGYLLLTYPSSPGVWNGTSATTRTPLTGDFDAMVDYNIVSPWQSWSNNHPAGMLVYTDSWNARIDVWAGSPTYGSIDSYNRYSNYGGATTSGKFRIKRIGSTYYMYFWNGSSWVNMINYGGRPAGQAYLQLMDFGPTGNSNVQYDNFIVSTQTYPVSGTLNLKYDSASSEAWDKLTFNGDIPSGTAIKLRTRTAETEAGLATATWSTYITISGSPIMSPKGRWIEVETSLSTTNAASTPVLRDISISQGHNPGDIFWQTDVPINLAQEAISELNNTIGTLGSVGKYFFEGTLSSGTGQLVAKTEYPFYVVQGNMTITLSPDKRLYKPGEAVTIGGEVKNLASIEATNLALTVKAKAGVGVEQILLSDTFAIPAGGSHPFQVTTVAGADGVVALTATVVQNASILAAVADQYEVAGPKVAATLSGPGSAGSDPFTLTLSLVNSGKTDAVISIVKSFKAETITIPSGQTRVLPYQQQITADTTYLFTIYGDLTSQLTKTVVYLAPKQAAKVSVKAVADRISYNANEKVAITTTINCLDAGTTGDSLTATVMIVNSDGEALFIDQFILSAPDTGRIYTNSSYWNTAKYPSGAYIARLVVDSGGTAMATSEASFTILPSSVSGAGVVGAVSPALNPVYLGIDESLAITLVNSGNEDLTGVILTVTVLDPDTQTIMQTYSKVIDLPRQGAFADTVTVPTATFETRDIMTPPVVNDIFSQIVTFTDEKLYPITATATNEVGTQTTVQRNIIYDKTPPNLTIDPVVTPTNAANQNVTGTREESTTVAVTCASVIFGVVEYPTSTSWRVSLAGMQEGENRLQAEAYDLAGNRATALTTILYVPRAPEVTVSAGPNQLWPPNKKLIPVTVAGNVLTFGADVKDITISVADEYGKYNLQGLKFGDTVLLEAWREGNDMDGRIYTITAVVSDQAGNRTTRSATVVVPHDMGK